MRRGVRLLLCVTLLEAADGWITEQRSRGPTLWTLDTTSRYSSRSDMSSIKSEQQDALRLLWEQEPFSVVDQIMKHFLNQNMSERVLLQPLQVKGFSSEKGQKNGDAFDNLYQGHLPTMNSESLSSRKSVKRNGHHSRSFRLDLAYDGSSFAGWQRQLNQTTLQGTIEDVLQDYLSYKVNVRVAGRTDAGVHAINQVARVRTAPNVTQAELFQVLQATTDHSWRCHQVTQVDDTFHPSFNTASRSYVYLIDGSALEAFYREHNIGVQEVVDRLDAMLRPLENHALDYVGLSYGRVKTQSTVCILYHAQARLLFDNTTAVVALEITGDRFLRRMVRILVATALSLLFDKDPDALKRLICIKDRSLAARPAPAQGLMFVGADIE